MAFECPINSIYKIISTSFEHASYSRTTYFNTMYIVIASIVNNNNNKMNKNKIDYL